MNVEHVFHVAKAKCKDIIIIWGMEVSERFVLQDTQLTYHIIPPTQNFPPGSDTFQTSKATKTTFSCWKNQKRSNDLRQSRSKPENQMLPKTIQPTIPTKLNLPISKHNLIDLPLTSYNTRNNILVHFPKT